MRRNHLLTALLCLTIAGCTAARVLTHRPVKEAAAAPSGVYTLDPDHAALLFGVDHLGFSQFRGRFDTLAGKLTFAPDAPETSQLSITIESQSVNTGVDALDRLLRAPDMLSANEHPTIHFESTGIELTGPAQGIVTGNLSLVGTTRAVSLTVQFNGAADNPLTGRPTLGFSATGTLDRAAFGLGKWRPAVGNAVDLTIEVEFVKQS